VRANQGRVQLPTSTVPHVSSPFRYKSDSQGPIREQCPAIRLNVIVTSHDSTRYLWWKEWHWNRSFLQVRRFPPVSIVSLSLHVNSCIIWGCSMNLVTIVFDLR
jgi:hypothetical protein